MTSARHNEVKTSHNKHEKNFIVCWIKPLAID